METSFKVVRADKHSAGFKAGIRKGDTVLAFDGSAPEDLLDCEFYEGGESFTVELLKMNGERKTVAINKQAYEPLGLEFGDEAYLKPAPCRNKCVFCFVDQLPRGMRGSLYFKDDDWRLSFVSGNYVTLTDLKESEAGRICVKKFSPLYISVHATDDKVRRNMLQNPGAAAIMPLLSRFAEHGIDMHAQIVLCPGLNDGKTLKKSLKDLFSLYPRLNSVAVVPVGLTRHRQKLTPVEPVSAVKAAEVIKDVESFASAAKAKTGRSFVWCSDEFYLKANLPPPHYGYYEEFPQIENGVGLLAKFETEFKEALSDARKPKKGGFTVITGVSAAEFIRKLVSSAKQKFPNINCSVLEIKNEFFGESVTVAGLVTARDIIGQAENLERTVLVPKTMLKERDTVFLDGMSVKQLGRKLKRRIKVVWPDGYEFCAALLAMGGNKYF